MRNDIEEFDWLGLMEGITYAHIANQSAANILDSAPSGVDGVGSQSLPDVSRNGQPSLSGYRNGADSQSSPLYLTASEIVDIVEASYKEQK